MTTQAVEELRSSLKSLYHDSRYSDLTIASRDHEYPVHKAIVCPRSEYFAAQCRDSGSKATPNNYLRLSDDDPQAIGMVVRYLYLLDYPSEPTRDAPGVNGLTNVHINGQTNGHAYTNGHDHDGSTNGGDQEDLNSTSAKADEPASEKDYKAEKDEATEPLDDFLPPQPQRLSKKQKKRNKAAKHEAERIGSPDPQNETLASPISPEVPIASINNVQEKENHSESGGASLDAKPSAPNGVKAPVNGKQDTKSLILHANVYALSRKYGIAGLRSLSFDKFRAEADSQWHTEEFLRAAERVYTSCGSGDGDEDREMKDVVVGMICRHGELMDNAETQKVIRTLPKDLMYDILMRVRVQGGFAL